MARILIVDDEIHIRKSLRRLVLRAGHECDLAANATDAWSQVNRAAADGVGYELVLSDVNMPPGESGIALARRLMEEHPDTAVVMVTAIDDPKIAEVALEHGAYGYLIKPCESNELYINIANALRRRALEIESREHRERLEHDVMDRTIELQKAIDNLEAKEVALRSSREEMIQRLAKAAEFRDNETAEHVQRMSRYCGMLARRLNLSDHLCDEIRLASLMHDVGKIGIPDAILLKPGKLTDEEFDAMKGHTEIGFRILSGSHAHLLTLAGSIAVTHHEKWDGNGYPRKLVGEAIPIEGRIAALADVFDALTSKRVYKEAMPVEKALSIMQDSSGSHFEPRLVDLFMDSIDQVLAIREQYADR